MNLVELMDARHLAYREAFRTGFKDGALFEAWRDANRAYVQARDKKPETIQKAA